MNRKITIRDIARELNTTVSTVSRALNNHPAISRETKEAVKLVAEKLNYRQNKLASSLRSGKTNIIGVLIPSAELSFFGSVVHGIEQVMNENGYNVLLYQTNESYLQEKRGIETFLQSRVEGIIASIALETQAYGHFQEIRQRNIPLVFFDRYTDEVQVPSVSIDDYKGGFLATEALIKQGYKRIAHISAQQHIRIFNDRLQGYTDALKHHHLPVVEELIAYGKVSVESGRECANYLLALPEPPDAIFAVEDFTALGALQILKAAQISVPDKIGLIGFANEAFSAYITPALSTIDQQTKRMGQEAARLFLELSAKDQRYEQEPKRIVLDPIVISRESSLRTEIVS